MLKLGLEISASITLKRLFLGKQQARTRITIFLLILACNSEHSDLNDILLAVLLTPFVSLLHIQWTPEIIYLVRKFSVEFIRTSTEKFRFPMREQSLWARTIIY